MHEDRFGRPLAILHYVYPVVVFLVFAVTYSISVFTLQTTSEAKKPPHPHRRAIFRLLAAGLVTFTVQAVAQIVEGFFSGRWASQDTTIGVLSCIVVFGMEQNSFGDGTELVWHPFWSSWITVLCFEPAIAVLSLVQAQTVSAKSSEQGILIMHASIVIVRWLIYLSTLLVYFLGGSKTSAGAAADAERQPLLPKPDQGSGDANGSTDSGYGTNTETSNTDTTNTDADNSSNDTESPWERRERLAREQMNKRLQDDGGWFAYVKGFTVLFPYVWPVNNRRLQLHAVLVGVCLLANNALNFFVPLQLGTLMDSLAPGSPQSPWTQVMIFAALRLAASESGISLLRRYLWLPVEYYSEEALSAAAFSQVMRLSSDFHDSKSSSDLILAISQGHAISNMLESICFQALPSLIDLIVAFTYLSIKFGPYEGFITVATGVAFIQAVSHMIASLKDKRKQAMKSYYEEHRARQAGIQGWHTVSVFNQIPYEEERYTSAVKAQVASMRSITTSYMFREAIQYLILLAGLLAGSFLAVYQIKNGQATAGDFVMLLTYWGQLTSPLRFFAGLGRSISRDLVDAERLLEVMLEKPTIVDRPDAKPLALKGGKVELRNVSFSYDKKKDILKGVKLSVPPGKTAAFVGATGAGKSTILKLLDRFYDVTGGSIQVDGQDIRDVTLDSVRQAIGMVPQAPVMFDDTVMNNIRYAKLGATDEEVYNACKAAAMHDQIMGFTEGYRTKVGERGVKLSGGELQRVAIARAILKQPDIVLLDEATSSVDTETEQKIQEGLQALCEGRTTFIVAHRLSTVMNADIIFVITDGELAEQGSHDELLEKNGRYAELWSKQIFFKPKEAKADKDSENKENEETNASNGHLNGSLDGPSGDATEHEPTNEAAKSNTPSKDGRAVNGQANDQEAHLPAAKTPNGHKREGSKLNPGAIEFTPRAAAVPKGPTTAPLPESWDEDVASEITARQSQLPLERDLVRGTPPGPAPKRATIDDHASIKFDQPRSGDAIPPSPTQAGVNESPENKFCRNVSDSFSCPDPLPAENRSSPPRSVSQPVSVPGAAKKENVADTQTPRPESQPRSSPKSGKADGRRGGNRSARGRSRGRARRGTTNTKSKPRSDDQGD